MARTEAEDATAELPVNERLKRYRQAVDAGRDARDPDLEELVFNFGRYVILSSSQPGNLPPTSRACGITA